MPTPRMTMKAIIGRLEKLPPCKPDVVSHHLSVTICPDALQSYPDFQRPKSSRGLWPHVSELQNLAPA